jgi:hypothetical protein
VIALVAAALALATPTPGKACLPISVHVAGSGTYTYEIRIEDRRRPCSDGREALRVFVTDAVSPGGWTCNRGHGPDAWAAACVRSGVVVRAYGPRRERDPWRIAAARLSMPVFAPSAGAVGRLGLRLASVRPEKLSCGAIREEVTAVYRSGKREARITEGKPRVCGDVGDLRLAAHPLVNGHRGALYELCEPAGCGRAVGPELLIFKQGGVEIGLQTKGISEAQLLALARTMEVVVT